MGIYLNSILPEKSASHSIARIKQNAGENISGKLHENILLLFSTFQCEIYARKQNKVISHKKFDLIIFIMSFDVFLLKVNSSVEIAEFRKEMADLANLYDWHLFKDEKLKRLFTKITDIGTAVQDDTEKLAKVGETIDVLYENKKVTVFNYKNFRVFFNNKAIEIKAIRKYVQNDKCYTIYS